MQYSHIVSSGAHIHRVPVWLTSTKALQTVDGGTRKTSLSHRKRRRRANAWKKIHCDGVDVRGTFMQRLESVCFFELPHLDAFYGLPPLELSVGYDLHLRIVPALGRHLTVQQVSAAVCHVNECFVMSTSVLFRNVVNGLAYICQLQLTSCHMPCGVY